MAKVLACRDVGVDCDFIACGSTEEEVLQKSAEHTRRDHGYTDKDFTPELEMKSRKAIHEEQVECR